MDSNEVTRLTRTAVQAFVAMLVAQLAALGIDVDQTVLMTLIFPIVMAVTTGIVAKLEEIPQAGALLILLNGPRRKPAYSAEAQAKLDAEHHGISHAGYDEGDLDPEPGYTTYVEPLYDDDLPWSP